MKSRPFAILLGLLLAALLGLLLANCTTPELPITPAPYWGS